MKALSFIPRFSWSARCLVRVQTIACGLAMALLAGGSVRAQQNSYLAFTVTIDGFSGGPRITIYNNSRNLQITNVTMTIGDPSRNFDVVTALTPPAGGSIAVVRGDSVNAGADTEDFSVNLTGFDPGEN